MARIHKYIKWLHYCCHISSRVKMAVIIKRQTGRKTERHWETDRLSHGQAGRRRNRQMGRQKERKTNRYAVRRTHTWTEIWTKTRIQIRQHTHTRTQTCTHTHTHTRHEQRTRFHSYLYTNPHTGIYKLKPSSASDTRLAVQGWQQSPKVMGRRDRYKTSEMLQWAILPDIVYERSDTETWLDTSPNLC